MIDLGALRVCARSCFCTGMHSTARVIFVHVCSFSKRHTTHVTCSPEMSASVMLFRHVFREVMGRSICCGGKILRSITTLYRTWVGTFAWCGSLNV